MKKLRFVLILICTVVSVEFIASLILLGIGSYLTIFYLIPSSCCKVFKNDTVCKTADRTQIYRQSCVRRTYEDMDKFSSYFNIVPNNNATSRPRSTSS